MTLDQRATEFVVFCIVGGCPPFTYDASGLHYLRRFRGIDFINRHYSVAHTQSSRDMVEDITDYCHRQVGLLV